MTVAEAAGELAFIELTTFPEGSTIWVTVGAIWAIEKNPKESYTLVKTPESMLSVMESPYVVFDRMKEVMAR